MIRKLRTRMILLVAVGLFLASAILVAAINWMNMKSVTDGAQAVLATLAENAGQRPGKRRVELEMESGATPPPKPGEEDNGNLRLWSDKPPRTLSDSAQGIFRGAERRQEIIDAADLATYYLVYLNEDGTVKSWESERAELYSDEKIAVFAQSALAQNQAFGRIGSRFFLRSGNTLIVLDSSKDLQNAQQFLRTTLLVALLQWTLLTAGAVWLIHRMVKPVDEAMEKQKQFVWDASHELKTPLAVISANAEVLAGEIGENTSLQYIQSEVQRTDKLVQNLLTLARMEKGTTRPADEKFDLSRALLSVALPFESAVFEAGKSFDIQVPDGIFYTGSSEMIQQLVMILLSNAMKYSDEHGAIALSLEARGDKRLIRVHNTGEPIPPDSQEKIFDRFYRVDSSHSRETPGNGLGLAIAKSIVEMHKGKITVQSEKEKGTTFTVTL